jgi:probable phosphoglycerate mutase
MNLNNHTRFGLIRHAQTIWNSEKRIQGQLDSPLTDKGKYQAASWGRILSQYQWDRCICSDLGRASTTAVIINEMIKVPLDYARELREQDWGQWSGLTLAQLSQDKFKDLNDQTRRGWEFCPTGGEDRNSVLKRVCQALKSAAAKWPGQTILAVTHEGVIKCLMYHLLKRLFLPNEPRILRPTHLHIVIVKQDELTIEKINALDLSNE